MAEPEPKNLIDFEWDLFDDEDPETRVEPPDGLSGEAGEEPPLPDPDDDDWP